MSRSTPLMETLPEARTHALRVKSFSRECIDFHWHFHPEVELVLVEKGVGVSSVGRSVQPYGPGDLFMIGANLPHAYGSHPAERRGAKWTVLHFLAERWGGEFWGLPENARLKRLLDAARCGFWVHQKEAEPFAERVRAIASDTSGSSRLVLFLGLIEQLSRYPLRCLDAQPEPALNGDARLQRVFHWVDRHITTGSALQSAAASEAGLSPQAFSRYFRERTGRTFQRYVNEVRVAHACSALANREAGIAEAAYEAGFQNLANFNRRFREITGVTPSRYRQACWRGFPGPEGASPKTQP